MRYTTDLINSIITSKQAEEVLNMVSPVYGNDYVSLWLFQAIGTQLDKVENWTEDYIKQINPRTATWSLPLWESEYGLITDTSLSTTQRQNNIINKMWSNNVINPAKLGEMVTKLTGFDSHIVERTGKRKFTIMISSRKYLTDEAAVKNLVDGVKPTHLLYDVNYENAVASNINVGGVIQKFKVINLKEV